jgi:hypothetical protein
MTLTITHQTNQLTTNQLSNQLSEQNSVHQIFTNIYEHEFKHRYETETECFEELLIFITATFKPELVSIKDSNNYRVHSIREFRNFNYSVNCSVLGNNLKRKRTLQPKGYAWVDFAGTRAGHGSVEFSKPHIHGLLLVRPELKFQYLCRMHTTSMLFPSIDSVVIRTFDSSRRSVESLAGYCMKGLKFVPNDSRQWLETMLPA